MSRFKTWSKNVIESYGRAYYCTLIFQTLMLAMLVVSNLLSDVVNLCIGHETSEESIAMVSGLAFGLIYGLMMSYLGYCVAYTHNKKKKEEDRIAALEDEIRRLKGEDDGEIQRQVNDEEREGDSGRS